MMHPSKLWTTALRPRLSVTGDYNLSNLLILVLQWLFLNPMCDTVIRRPRCPARLLLVSWRWCLWMSSEFRRFKSWCTVRRTRRRFAILYLRRASLFKVLLSDTERRWIREFLFEWWCVCVAACEVWYSRTNFWGFAGILSLSYFPLPSNHWKVVRTWRFPWLFQHMNNSEKIIRRLFPFWNIRTSYFPVVTYF